MRGRTRRLIVPARFSMQVGIRALMGAGFLQFLGYLFRAPWDRVLSRTR